MRFDSILVEISATPLYLLLLLALMLVLLHVVLVVWWKLDDIAWKRVDYLWLSAAAIGLWASSAQAERFLSERYARYVEGPSTASAYRFLRQTLTEPVVCLPHTKSADSPPDFDQMVQEQQGLCKQAKDIASRMPPSLNEYPPLEAIGFMQFGQDAKYETDFVREVNRRAEEYRREQQRYSEFLKTSKPSSGDEVLTVLGPMLLAFALALRITKVTGEIRNARRKKQA